MDENARRRRDRRRELHTILQELMPLRDGFGVRFYERLFEIDPEIGKLFRGGMERQASMLVNALAVSVLGFLDERRGERALRDLGARHGGYGVTARHYDSFGEALIWSFERELGERFTPELRRAWEEAWREIAATMQESGGAAAP